MRMSLAELDAQPVALLPERATLHGGTVKVKVVVVANTEAYATKGGTAVAIGGIGNEYLICL
jgi:hypothetical protein